MPGYSNSLTKALQQQGIQKAVSKTKNETVFWQERERAFITSLCRERGLEICEKGEKRDNLTLPQYKAVMAEVDRLEKKNIDLRAEQTKISAEAEKSDIRASLPQQGRIRMPAER